MPPSSATSGPGNTLWEPLVYMLEMSQSPLWRSAGGGGGGAVPELGPLFENGVPSWRDKKLVLFAWPEWLSGESIAH